MLSLTYIWPGSRCEKSSSSYTWIVPPGRAPVTSSAGPVESCAVPIFTAADCAAASSLFLLLSLPPPLSPLLQLTSARAPAATATTAVRALRELRMLIESSPPACE